MCKVSQNLVRWRRSQEGLKPALFMSGKCIGSTLSRVGIEMAAWGSQLTVSGQNGNTRDGVGLALPSRLPRQVFPCGTPRPSRPSLAGHDRLAVLGALVRMLVWRPCRKPFQQADLGSVKPILDIDVAPTRPRC